MKAKKLLITFAVIGIYAIAIVFVRLNPAMIAFRKNNGGDIILGAWFFVFILSIVFGSIFAKHYDKPENKKEKVGWALLQVASYSRFVFLLLIPIIVAMLIK